MTLEKLIKKYEKIASQHDKEAEAIKWLIMELSFYTPNQFYMHLKDEMTESFIKMIDEAVDQYVFQHIPVQHILGFSYFYGYKFKVNNQVLIPRRETEELVEEVILQYDENFSNQVVNVLDLGTGSGCIAVTLSVEEPNMKVTAVDLSETALLVAKENNKELGGTVQFLQSNWFSNVTNRFDVIVANPPYIPNSEAVEDIVEKEPDLALYGGVDGLMPYDIILRDIKNHLNDKAIIAFEHGHQHKDAIKALIEKYLPGAVIYQKKDLQGKDRMTFVGLGGVSFE